MASAAYSEVPSEEFNLEEHPSNELSESLLKQGDQQSPKRQSKSSGIAWTFICLGLFTIGLIFGSALMYSTGFYFQLNKDKECSKLHSTWSPLMDEVDMGYHRVQLNGTFGYDSIYRQDPSPEVDAAWKYITSGMGITRMSEEDFIKANVSLDSARLPDEYGGGYIAFIEVFHQIHCVDFLRKATWFNIDYYMDKGAEFTDELPRAKEHLVHCIDMLRQVLMCHADLNVIGTHWTREFLRPYPNFNIVHECRNFDAIIDWAYAHEIPPEPPGHQWKPLPGEKIFDSPP